MKKSNNKLLCLVVLIIVLMIICCLRKNEKFFTLGDTSCELIPNSQFIKKEKCNGLVGKRENLIRIRSEIMEGHGGMSNQRLAQVANLNRQIDLISMAIAKLTPGDKQGDGAQVFLKPHSPLIQYNVKANRNYESIKKCKGRPKLGCWVQEEQGDKCIWDDEKGECVLFRAPLLYKDSLANNDSVNNGSGNNGLVNNNPVNNGSENNGLVNNVIANNGWE